MHCLIIGDVSDDFLKNTLIDAEIRVEPVLAIPTNHQELASLRLEVAQFFNQRTPLVELADYGKRILSFLNGTPSFDRFVIVNMPGNTDFRGLGASSSNEWVKIIGNTIREPVRMKLFLSILLTTDQELLQKPVNALECFSAILNYSSMSSDSADAKCILFSCIDCFQEGVREFRRYIGWERRKTVFDIAFVGLVIPILIGIFTKIGEKIFDHAGEIYKEFKLLTFSIPMQVFSVLIITVITLYLLKRLLSLR